jgi:ribose 5-phosphate isomerase B|uniref:Ribose 5-phosphate isomerase B n=1 Tax=candidate division WOR-3 bacterium TaxID=2052148 RepID=A0A7V3PSY6_UNCW3
MIVAIGADHRGFRLKEKLKEFLRQQGYRIVDKGTFTPERTDYPDYAFAVGEAVASHRAQRGILICATGIGMSIAANKIAGVRAALCFNQKTARLSREHNDANVLCLGADLLTSATARRIVHIFLKTRFTRGRHRRRIQKILSREKNG